MTIKTNLFLEETLIGKEEAPQHVLETEQLAHNYLAVLNKRLGNITAYDFLKYARRLSVLCKNFYRESNIELELYVNKSVSLRFAVFQGMLKGASGEKIDVGQLTVDAFREIFESSCLITLCIFPMIEVYGINYAFSKIEWRGEMPKKIVIFSQDMGGKYDKNRMYHRGPLHDLLIRKMFYVSGTAPSFNFAVKLGVAAIQEQDEGKMF